MKVRSLKPLVGSALSGAHQGEVSALHQGRGTVADKGELCVLSQPVVLHLHAEPVHVRLAQETEPVAAPRPSCFLSLLKRFGHRCLALVLDQMMKLKVDLRGWGWSTLPARLFAFRSRSAARIP